MIAMTDPLVRNRGITNEEDQRRIADATVAVAGCGGDGGQFTESFTRLGGRKYRLADPEVFSGENLNRQAGCYLSTLGCNKAEAMKVQIQRISKNVDVKVYTEGVTESNVAEFLTGATVLVDETEYTEHRLAVMLAREARKLRIPNIMAMNVGWGCLVTSFQPDGYTVEEFLGLDPDAPLDEIAATPVPLERWLAGRFPIYANMEMVAQVAAGEIPAPSVVVGVLMAASHLVFEVANHICQWREPRVAPRVFWADAHEEASGILMADVSAIS